MFDAKVLSAVVMCEIEFVHAVGMTVLDTLEMLVDLQVSQTSKMWDDFSRNLSSKRVR